MGTPGVKRQSVEFDPPGLHQHDAEMHIDEQIRLWPGGELDLFLEKSVCLLDGLPVAGCLETLRGWFSRKTARGQGEGEGCSKSDEKPSIAQIRI